MTTFKIECISGEPQVTIDVKELHKFYGEHGMGVGPLLTLGKFTAHIDKMHKRDPESMKEEHLESYLTDKKHDIIGVEWLKPLRSVLSLPGMLTEGLYRTLGKVLESIKNGVLKAFEFAAGKIGKLLNFSYKTLLALAEPDEYSNCLIGVIQILRDLSVKVTGCRNSIELGALVSDWVRKFGRILVEVLKSLGVMAYINALKQGSYSDLQSYPDDGFYDVGKEFSEKQKSTVEYQDFLNNDNDDDGSSSSSRNVTIDLSNPERESLLYGKKDSVPYSKILPSGSLSKSENRFEAFGIKFPTPKNAEDLGFLDWCEWFFSGFIFRMVEDPTEPSIYEYFDFTGFLGYINTWIQWIWGLLKGVVSRIIKLGETITRLVPDVLLSMVSNAASHRVAGYFLPVVMYLGTVAARIGESNASVSDYMAKKTCELLLEVPLKQLNKLYIAIKVVEILETSEFKSLLVEGGYTVSPFPSDRWDLMLLIHSLVKKTEKSVPFSDLTQAEQFLSGHSHIKTLLKRFGNSTERGFWSLLDSISGNDIEIARIIGNSGPIKQSLEKISDLLELVTSYSGKAGVKISSYLREFVYEKGIKQVLTTLGGVATGTGETIKKLEDSIHDLRESSSSVNVVFNILEGFWKCVRWAWKLFPVFTATAAIVFLTLPLSPLGYLATPIAEASPYIAATLTITVEKLLYLKGLDLGSGIVSSSIVFVIGWFNLALEACKKIISTTSEYVSHYRNLLTHTLTDGLLDSGSPMVSEPQKYYDWALGIDEYRSAIDQFEQPSQELLISFMEFEDAVRKLSEDNRNNAWKRNPLPSYSAIEYVAQIMHEAKGTQGIRKVLSISDMGKANKIFLTHITDETTLELFKDMKIKREKFKNLLGKEQRREKTGQIQKTGAKEGYGSDFSAYISRITAQLTSIRTLNKFLKKETGLQKSSDTLEDLVKYMERVYFRYSKAYDNLALKIFPGTTTDKLFALDETMLEGAPVNQRNFKDFKSKPTFDLEAYRKFTQECCLVVSEMRHLAIVALPELDKSLDVALDATLKTHANMVLHATETAEEKEKFLKAQEELSELSSRRFRSVFDINPVTTQKLENHKEQMIKIFQGDLSNDLQKILSNLETISKYIEHMRTIDTSIQSMNDAMIEELYQREYEEVGFFQFLVLVENILGWVWIFSSVKRVFSNISLFYELQDLASSHGQPNFDPITYFGFGLASLPFLTKRRLAQEILARHANDDFINDDFGLALQTIESEFSSGTLSKTNSELIGVLGDSIQLSKQQQQQQQQQSSSYQGCYIKETSIFDSISDTIKSEEFIVSLHYTGEKLPPLFNWMLTAQQKQNVASSNASIGSSSHRKLLNYLFASLKSSSLLGKILERELTSKADSSQLWRFGRIVKFDRTKFLVELSLRKLGKMQPNVQEQEEILEYQMLKSIDKLTELIRGKYSQYFDNSDEEESQNLSGIRISRELFSWLSSQIFLGGEPLFQMGRSAKLLHSVLTTESWSFYQVFKDSTDTLKLMSKKAKTVGDTLWKLEVDRTTISSFGSSNNTLRRDLWFSLIFASQMAVTQIRKILSDHMRSENFFKLETIKLPTGGGGLKKIQAILSRRRLLIGAGDKETTTEDKESEISFAEEVFGWTLGKGIMFLDNVTRVYVYGGLRLSGVLTTIPEYGFTWFLWTIFKYGGGHRLFSMLGNGLHYLLSWLPDYILSPYGDNFYTLSTRVGLAALGLYSASKIIGSVLSAANNTLSRNYQNAIVLIGNFEGSARITDLRKKGSVSGWLYWAAYTLKIPTMIVTWIARKIAHLWNGTLKSLEIYFRKAALWIAGLSTAVTIASDAWAVSKETITQYELDGSGSPLVDLVNGWGYWNSIHSFQRLAEEKLGRLEQPPKSQIYSEQVATSWFTFFKDLSSYTNYFALWANISQETSYYNNSLDARIKRLYDALFHVSRTFNGNQVPADTERFFKLCDTELKYLLKKNPKQSQTREKIDGLRDVLKLMKKRLENDNSGPQPSFIFNPTGFGSSKKHSDQGRSGQGEIDQGQSAKEQSDQGEIDQGQSAKEQSDQGEIDQGEIDQGEIDQGEIDQGGQSDQEQSDQEKAAAAAAAREKAAAAAAREKAAAAAREKAAADAAREKAAADAREKAAAAREKDAEYLSDLKKLNVILKRIVPATVAAEPIDAQKLKDLRAYFETKSDYTDRKLNTEESQSVIQDLNGDPKFNYLSDAKNTRKRSVYRIFPLITIKPEDSKEIIDKKKAIFDKWGNDENWNGKNGVADIEYAQLSKAMLDVKAFDWDKLLKLQEPIGDEAQFRKPVYYQRSGDKQREFQYSSVEDFGMPSDVALTDKILLLPLLLEDVNFTDIQSGTITIKVENNSKQIARIMFYEYIYHKPFTAVFLVTARGIPYPLSSFPTWFGNLSDEPFGLDQDRSERKFEPKPFSEDRPFVLFSDSDEVPAGLHDINLRHMCRILVDAAQEDGIKVTQDLKDLVMKTFGDIRKLLISTIGPLCSLSQVDNIRDLYKIAQVKFIDYLPEFIKELQESQPTTLFYPMLVPDFESELLERKEACVNALLKIGIIPDTSNKNLEELIDPSTLITTRANIWSSM